MYQKSRRFSRMALAISLATPLLIADTIVQPSASDDVSNLGFSEGLSAGIPFVGTDTATPANGTSFRSYWIFDLPTGTGPITSATFDLKPRAYFGDGSSQTVNFTEFLLSPSLLTTAYSPGDATGLSVYDALGSGATYGQLTVQPADVVADCQLSTCPVQTGNTLSFQLNATGLADVNADLGGVLVIGAFISPSAANPTFNAVGVQFNLVNDSRVVAQLDLTSAPEPASASLFVIGGFGLLALRRLRR